MEDSRRVAARRRTDVSAHAPSDQPRTEGPVVKHQKKRRTNPTRRPSGMSRRTRSGSSVPIESQGVEAIAGPLAKLMRTEKNGANEANRGLSENQYGQELKTEHIDFSPREGTQFAASGRWGEASSTRFSGGDRASGPTSSWAAAVVLMARRRSGRGVGFVRGESRWGERGARDELEGARRLVGLRRGLRELRIDRYFGSAYPAQEYDCAFSSRSSRPLFRFPSSPARVVSHHSVPSRRDGLISCAKRFPSG